MRCHDVPFSFLVSVYMFGAIHGGHDALLALLSRGSQHCPSTSRVCQICVCAICGQVKLLLGGAVGGLHTMVDEHFGISIVQYMAAGACAHSRVSAECLRRPRNHEIAGVPGSAAPAARARLTCFCCGGRGGFADVLAVHGRRCHPGRQRLGGPSGGHPDDTAHH